MAASDDYEKRKKEFLGTLDLLGSFLDDLARGRSLSSQQIAFALVAVKDSREMMKCLDQDGMNDDGLFKTTLIEHATRLINRIRKINPTLPLSRRCRMLIKAAALYCLWTQTSPSTQQGVVERIKTSAKIAVELKSEQEKLTECDDEILQAATIAIDQWALLEKRNLSENDLNEVAYSTSKSLEILLQLMQATQVDANEICHRIIALLEIAQSRPKLLLARGITVASQFASYLMKGKHYRQAKDAIVSILQAMESMPSKGPPSSRTLLHSRSLTWLLAECWVNLGDIEKSLTCLNQLEVLQEGEGGGAGGGSEGRGIDPAKIQLAKISCLLRGGTADGLTAAKSIVLSIGEAGDIDSALKGTRSIVCFQRYESPAFDLYDELFDRVGGWSSSSATSTSASITVLMDNANVLSVAIQAANSDNQQLALIERLVKLLTPLPAMTSTTLAFGYVELNKLQQIIKQAIFSNTKFIEHNNKQSTTTLWSYTNSLCDVLLKLASSSSSSSTSTSQQQQEERELILCTRSHALLQLGQTQDALKVAQGAYQASQTERSRANLFWISASSAAGATTTGSSTESTSTLTGGEDAVLHVLKQLLTSSSVQQNRVELLDSILCLGKVVGLTLSDKPQHQYRLLKSILEEALVIWKQVGWEVTTPSSSSAKGGAGGVHVFQVIRALLEVVISCYARPTGQVSTFPSVVFSVSRCSEEVWRVIVMNALPALEAVNPTAVNKSCTQDLRWLSTMCYNFGIGLKPDSGKEPVPNNCSNFFVCAFRFYEASGTVVGGVGATESDEKRRIILLMLAVCSSLASRNQQEGLNPREKRYWLSHLSNIKSRIRTLHRSGNLERTALIVEILIRCTPGKGPSTSLEGGERDVYSILQSEEHLLAGFPFEVLHLLAGACLKDTSSSSSRQSATLLYRAALKQCQKGAPRDQEKAFWIYADLLNTSTTTTSSLEIVREFKVKADTFRPSTLSMISDDEERSQSARRRVATKMSVSLYNEGVARLELMQEGAGDYISAAISLFPHAEERFQDAYRDRMESTYSVCMHLDSATTLFTSSSDPLAPPPPPPPPSTTAPSPPLPPPTTNAQHKEKEIVTTCPSPTAPATATGAGVSPSNKPEEKEEKGGEGEGGVTAMDCV